MLTLTNTTLTLDNQRDCLERAVALGSITHRQRDAYLVNGTAFADRLEWLDAGGDCFAYIDDAGDMFPLTFWSALYFRRSPECVAAITREEWRALFAAHRPFCDQVKLRGLRMAGGVA
jgi:hypothetical protein